METLIDLIMPWQDTVFAVGIWIFAFALIPTIKARDKPAFPTSLLTGTVMGIFAFTYATLSLWYSALSALVLSIMWFALAALAAAVFYLSLKYYYDPAYEEPPPVFREVFPKTQ